jgi:hypothetical protein
MAMHADEDRMLDLYNRRNHFIELEEGSHHFFVGSGTQWVSQTSETQIFVLWRKMLLPQGTKEQ